MVRQAWVTVAVLSVAFVMALEAWAGERHKSGTAEPAPLVEQAVFRLVSAQHRQTLYISNDDGDGDIDCPNYLLTFAPAGSDATQQCVLKDDRAAELPNVKKIKPGDYVTYSTNVEDGVLCVDGMEIYTLHPGEDVANVYVYAEAGEADKTGQHLRLFKLGRFGPAVIAADKAGSQAVYGRLHVGDSVLATGSQAGGALWIQDLWVYRPPAVALLTSVEEGVAVPAGRTMALKLTVDKENVTVLIPGEANMKGLWVPNPVLVTAAGKYKAGEYVHVAMRSDGQTNWLESIAAAPRPPGK